MPALYPDGQTMSLREEALRRVREMQRLAQRSIDETNNIESQGKDEPHYSESGDRTPPQHSRPEYARQNKRPNAVNPKGFPPRGIADLLERQGFAAKMDGIGESVQNTVSSVSQPIADLLDSFGIDGEKLVILMVMWAVFNEHKENKTLLLALGYLLL